jgi:hypothetical protein
VTSPTPSIIEPVRRVLPVSDHNPRKPMSPALLNRPSGSTRIPSRAVRDFAAARRRREADDLRQRAQWVQQARHTPRLEDWLDDGDLLDLPARDMSRIALLLARRR